MLCTGTDTTTEWWFRLIFQNATMHWKMLKCRIQIHNNLTAISLFWWSKIAFLSGMHSLNVFKSNSGIGYKGISTCGTTSSAFFSWEGMEGSRNPVSDTKEWHLCKKKCCAKTNLLDLNYFHTWDIQQAIWHAIYNLSRIWILRILCFPRHPL